MSEKVIVVKENLDELADSINAKLRGGSKQPLTLSEMNSAVRNASGSGVSMFVATYTKENDIWKCDKTFAQIKYAFDNGAIVVALALGGIAQLCQANSTMFVFSALWITDDSENTVFGTIYHYSDNSIVYYTDNLAAYTKSGVLDNYVLKGDFNAALATKQDAPLVFSNLSVATTDWVADSTYSGLGYKAVLTCTGVTASMYADVYLSSASASLNIVASFCDEGTDSVTIYATSNDAITIDKVVAS